MRIRRIRWVAAVLAVCLLLGIMPLEAMRARAADQQALSGAQRLTSGQSVTVTMEPNGAYYYVIGAAAAGQFLTAESDAPALKLSFLDGTGATMNDISATGEGLTVMTKAGGDHYLLFNAVDLTETTQVTFTVRVEDNDGYEENNTTVTARAIGWDEPVEFTLGGEDQDWFRVDTQKAGQTIVLTANTGNMIFTVRDTNANTLSSNGGQTAYYVTKTAGRHYICPDIWHTGIGTVTGSFTAVLLDNDDYEPNGSAAEAAALTIGQTVENIMTNPGDRDWFKIEVDAGQIVTAQVSNQKTSVAFYNADGGYISSIGYEDKYSFTAPSSGICYVVCSSDGYEGNVTTSLTVTVEENDTYEPNGTSAAAAALTSGQNAAAILGAGETDWFRVSAAAGQFAAINVESDLGIGTAVFAGDGETLLKSGSAAQFSGVFFSGDEETYYIRLQGRGGRTGRAAVSVTLTDNDGFEPNNTALSAHRVEAGVPAELVVGAGDTDWLRFDTSRAGEIIQVDVEGRDIAAAVYGADGVTQLASGRGTDYTVSVITGEAGAYYIKVWAGDTAAAAAVTVTRRSNDAYEPNGTRETAVELTDGETITTMLAPGDVDWFFLTTSRAGQDICLDIGGFDYGNQGRFQLQFDETISHRVDGNGRLWLHASLAGKHYIRLADGEVKTENGSCETGFLPLTITAAAVNGDAGESGGNDEAENARQLLPGTDAAFSLGGWGDEDWFRFEAAPQSGEPELFTLCLLDLAADGSDRLIYEVYAPDGTKVVEATLVSMHHAADIACHQQGMYRVRITNRCEDGSYLPVSRSELRIRVSPGGGDPYENNDTWLTAAVIRPGQRIEHVLASAADRDWFCFTAEAADMSFLLERDKNGNAQLYRAEDLAQYGDGAEMLSAAAACKLEKAGVYYLCLSAGSAYVSEELRSFTVVLTEHGGEENNDTWSAAKPLYAGAARSFDIAGANDNDWFSLAVPAEKDTLSLVVETTGSIRMEIYEQSGLNGAAVYSGNLGSGQRVVSLPVQPGTYYIRVQAGGRILGASLTAFVLESGGGTEKEDAVALEQGVWSQSAAVGCWYSLGELKAGDVLRYSRDGAGGEAKVYLYNSTGKTYLSQSAYANFGFNIPGDETYFLYVEQAAGVDSSGEPRRSRIRYRIGSGDSWAHALEGPEELMLLAGETRFVELMMAPYGAKGGTARIYMGGNTNPGVAVFNERTGHVTARSAGTTQMTFEINCNGQYLAKTVEITVAEPVAAESIAIEGAPEEMTVGDTALLTAAVSPGDATEQVTWTSSDPNVLHVSAGGRVVAVGAGQAQITATTATAEDSVAVTVLFAPEQEQAKQVLLDAYTLTMYMGEGTAKLTASVLPAGAEVEWTSSNTAAAVVDQNGVISALAPGVAVVTARAGDAGAGCVVTVLPERIRVTGVTLAVDALQLLLGESTALTAVVEPHNATTKTLLWVSDDERVAKVSRTGVVTAVAVGETTVRVVTQDGGFAAEIVVTVTAKPGPGDINGDGWVDSGDALLALQVAVGKRVLTDEQRRWADVNGDGRVDAGDAIRILRYDAGLIDSLE